MLRGARPRGTLTMPPPSTAREVLIAEALGDAARLFDRIEALTAKLEATRQALTDANDELAARLEAFDTALASATQRARTATLDHVARQAAPAVQRLVQSHATAMDAAARQTLSEQLEPLLKQQIGLIRQLALRLERPWDTWLAHAATAACSAAFTWWAVTAHFQR